MATEHVNATIHAYHQGTLDVVMYASGNDVVSPLMQSKLEFSILDVHTPSGIKYLAYPGSAPPFENQDVIRVHFEPRNGVTYQELFDFIDPSAGDLKVKLLQRGMINHNNKRLDGIIGSMDYAS